MSQKNLKKLSVYIPFSLGVILILLYVILEIFKNDYLFEYGFLFGVPGIILIAIAIGLYLRFKDDSSPKVKKLANEVKFKYQLDDIYVSNDLSGVLGISNEKKILYMMQRMDLTTGVDFLSDQLVVNAISFGNIKKINIIENDNIIVKSTDGDSVGKSVKGGFGYEGTDRKKWTQIVRIQAITNDVLKPSIDVILYNSKFGFKHDSEEYNDFFNTITKWLNLIQRSMNVS